MKTKISKNKKRLIIGLSITLVLLIILLVVVPMVMSVYIYNMNFNMRHETISWMKRSLDEFDGLNSDRFTFDSDKNKLVGYCYYKDSQDIKGVVVIAHGLGGGGHNSYLGVADYFASNNYIVFAYDATGNDESEGESVFGIPQGLIDLDYALCFVKSEERFKDLPIMLFGHSWGAYSIGNVLNIHTDVKAAVMIAGFNKSTDIIKEVGESIMGGAINYLMPFVSMVERSKFGRYASYSSIDGIEASNANIMIVHSADDEMISYENQYKMLYNLYKDNPRFSFVGYENRGHNFVFCSDNARDYIDQLNIEFAAFVNSLDVELTAEIKTEYMNEHLDKAKMFELDTKFMNDILSLYDKSIA